MTYSVWNWNTLRYDYYRAAGDVGPGQFAGPRDVQYRGDSVRPEDALPILPGDALRIGAGDAAKGRIAVREEEASLGQTPPPQAEGKGTWLTGALLLAAGVFLITR